MLPDDPGVLRIMPEDSGALGIVGESGSFSDRSFRLQLKEEIFGKIIPMLPSPREREVFIRLFEPWPEWTLIAIGKYCAAFFPTLKPEQIITGIMAIFKGDFSGCDHLTHSKIMGHFSATLKHLEANPVSQGFSPEEINDILYSSKKQVSECMELILSLPKRESEICLKAYTKAYSSTFSETGQPLGVKTNQPILWALIFRWPMIEKMSSVTALHDYLKTVLPENLVGDKKRLEALCRAYKIKFRQRGRPRKS